MERLQVSTLRRMRKLQTLLRKENTTLEEQAEHGFSWGTVDAICVNHGCNYTTLTEPDQDEGYCPNCRMCSVVSSLVLAGVA
jgi:hypothetical protein